MDLGHFFLILVVAYLLRYGSFNEPPAIGEHDEPETGRPEDPGSLNPKDIVGGTD